MLRIVYPESRIPIFPSRILDPHSFHPGSRIRIKEFKYFNSKKLFLSTWKYDLGCSSRIWIPDPDPEFLPIPDPESGGHKGTGSGSATLISMSEPGSGSFEWSDPGINPQCRTLGAHTACHAGPGPSTSRWCKFNLPGRHFSRLGTRKNILRYSEIDCS